MTKPALTENGNPATANIDLADSCEIARLINEEDKKVPAAISRILPEIGQAIEMIAQAFLAGGRLAYFGAGTSGRIGVLDASECPPTFGVAPELVSGFIAGGERALRFAVENSEDNAAFGLADLQRFNPQPQDVVVAVSASGNPAYVVSVLQEARKRGCKTVGISSNPEAALKKYADIFLNPLVGPEVITGSSRMKSGTAQKLILNMLTTGAMIRTGKTYGNLMVDLSVSNQKLYDRACRIVSEIGGVSYPEAEKYLALSQNKVKLACVMAAKDCSLTEAEALLQQNRGILRKTL